MVELQPMCGLRTGKGAVPRVMPRTARAAGAPLAVVMGLAEWVRIATWMRRTVWAAAILLVGLANVAQATTTENPEDPGLRTNPAPDPHAEGPEPPRRGPPLGLNFRVRGGATYQFPTKLKDGGSFTTSRSVLDIGARYGFTHELSTIVSVSYGFDPYDFSSDAQIGGVQPWTELHTLRISAPIFWEPAPSWRVLMVPLFRMQADTPQAWSDSMTGGAMAAFSYKFTKDLSVGPGVGVISEIEQRPTIFPVLLIDWQIDDRFAITTGRGLGASTGPGLMGIYTVHEHIDLTLGFRFERTRFRLSQESGVPGGIGEDESFPVFVTLRFGPRWAFIALLTGAEFRGRLSISDANGDVVAESEYKPAGFVGVAGQIFF